MSWKLYKVTLRGLQGCSTGPTYGCSYVVAQHLDEAYRLVRDFLDREGIGFLRERELHSIELIAEETRYPECRTILFIERDHNEGDFNSNMLTSCMPDEDEVKRLAERIRKI